MLDDGSWMEHLTSDIRLPASKSKNNKKKPLGNPKGFDICTN
jgi:hypothetical protein